jgi:hypothetical protein
MGWIHGLWGRVLAGALTATIVLPMPVLMAKNTVTAEAKHKKKKKGGTLTPAEIEALKAKLAKDEALIKKLQQLLKNATNAKQKKKISQQLGKANQKLNKDAGQAKKKAGTDFGEGGE